MEPIQWIQFLLLIFLHKTDSEQSCPLPDVPRGGSYFPKDNNYLPGDQVTFTCKEGYILTGNEIIRCETDGEWSNPIPFCDRKARIENLYAIYSNSYQHSIPEVTDGNRNTCFPLKTGESLQIVLDKDESLNVVRMFLNRGNTNIQITNGIGNCSNYERFVDADQWVLIYCEKNNPASNLIMLKENSRTEHVSAFCEIEIYIKEEGCEKPPRRRISNGYFEVTRSFSKLICEDGYETDINNDRFVCENNTWVGSGLQCSEILCSPELPIQTSAENHWPFIDHVKKIRKGTRRKLECHEGYTIIGGPNEVACQKNGDWEETNATCIEIPKANADTNTIIIFGVVGAIVLLFSVFLAAYRMHFASKHRNNIVEDPNPQTEESVTPLKDLSAGFESEYESPENVRYVSMDYGSPENVRYIPMDYASPEDVRYAPREYASSENTSTSYVSTEYASVGYESTYYLSMQRNLSQSTTSFRPTQ